MVAYANSNTVAGSYGKVFSAYDVARKPETYGKVVQKYGDGFKLLNFLHLAGQTMDVGTESVKIIEKGVMERPVTVSIPESLSAPINPVITFATADDSDHYAREGFDIIVPATYTNSDVPEAMRIYLDNCNKKLCCR